MSALVGPGRESDVADWLALVAAPGVGPRTAQRLIAYFGDPAAVCRASAQALKDLSLIHI